MDPLVRYVPLVEAGTRNGKRDAVERVVKFYEGRGDDVYVSAVSLDLSRTVLPIDMWCVVCRITPTS